jgi:hypothetical protein
MVLTKTGALCKQNFNYILSRGGSNICFKLRCVQVFIFNAKDAKEYAEDAKPF